MVKPQQYPKNKCKAINYIESRRISTVLESATKSLSNRVSHEAAAMVLLKKCHDLTMSSHTSVQNLLSFMPTGSCHIACSSTINSSHITCCF